MSSRDPIASASSSRQDLARMRSSTTMSSSSSIGSSSMPSSPGPSVSLRATRSSTPTPVLSPTGQSSNLAFGAARSRAPQDLARGASYGGKSSGASYRDRSFSNMSNATAGTRGGVRQQVQRPPLLGRTSSNSTHSSAARLGRNQLAVYNSTLAPIPGVPPILINGTERPEEVDVASIGKIPSTSVGLPSSVAPRSPMPDLTGAGHTGGTTTTPEATSAGVDSLFVRFAVKEVRGIATRGRQKAEGKREELRTMVGERYRDLLGAADSIVRMRKSSGTLLGKLSRARDECDRDVMVARAADEDMTRSRMLSRATSSSTPSGHTPYAIATLVKTLLDAPEHIWRALERNDYLSAARLEGIGRAVYRELVTSGNGGQGRRRDLEEEEEGYSLETSSAEKGAEEGEENADLLAAFPLIEQQKEALEQLGPQITQRARAHMKAWDVPSLDAAEALAALILLDNIDLSEALRLTLQARAETLQALFSESTGIMVPIPRRPSANPKSPAMQKASSSSSAIPGGSREVDEVVRKCKGALGVLLTTHDHINTLFVTPTASAQSALPLLLHLLDLLQTPAPCSTSPNTTVASTAHLRSDAPASSHTMPGVLPSVFASLPNTHLLMRYLPAQILTFTPYIDTTASSSLDSSVVSQDLQAWHDACLGTLAEGLSKLLATLTSAKQLTAVQGSLHAFLAGKSPADDVGAWEAQIATLRGTLEAALGERFRQIYRFSLDRLAQAVPQSIQAGLRALQESKEDLDPTLFLFSPSIPFPSTSVILSTLAIPGNTGTLSTLPLADSLDPFDTFKEAVEKRINGRSPALDSCLSELEGFARDISLDVSTWLAGSHLIPVSDQKPGYYASNRHTQERQEYLTAAHERLNVVQESLRGALQIAMEPHQQIYIGSLAQHLALDSMFVPNLLLVETSSSSTKAASAALRDSLLSIERDSLSRWRESAVEASVQALKSSLASALSSPAPSNTSKPSHSLAASLMILLQSLRQVGPHRCQESTGLLPSLLAAFEKAFLEAYGAHLAKLRHTSGGRTSALALQGRTDLAYVKHLLQEALHRTPSEHAQGWSELEEQLSTQLEGADSGSDEATTQSFQRSQNLLAPLLSATYRSLLPQGDGGSSLLLPFGQAPALNAADIKLELAKPGPRFALLPLNATAA